MRIQRKYKHNKGEGAVQDNVLVFNVKIIIRN